jgi:hypothetical protein
MSQKESTPPPKGKTKLPSSGNIYEAEMLRLYPSSLRNEDGSVVVKIYTHTQLMVSIYISRELDEVYAWDDAGTNYEIEVAKVVNDNKPKHDSNDFFSQVLVLTNGFLDEINRSTFGLDISTIADNYKDNITSYDTKRDTLFWARVISESSVIVDRNLVIFTWGTAFLLEPPSGCEKVFNAAVLPICLSIYYWLIDWLID